MKLLFDENVSHRLVSDLANEYPGSAHVRSVGLRGAEDHQIWDHARMHGFAIVSKDTDFRERSYVEGFPPKIIWLRLGNCSTSEVEEVLRRNFIAIRAFDSGVIHSSIRCTPAMESGITNHIWTIRELLA